MRKSLMITAATAALFVLPTAAFADSHTQQFRADVTQANDSGASATADLSLDGNELTVSIDGQGFYDGFPHAIHFHGEPGGDNVCGPLNPSDPGFAAADADGDGFISVVEGVPAYGGVTVSLTTEGDTSPDSALAVDRFPTSSTLDYSRTITVSDEVAENLSTLHVVVHGADLDGTGEIGSLELPSSLDPELPLEATIPAACGQITAVAAGGVATGAGGTATSSTDTGLLAAGVLGLGAFGAATALRRRGNEVA